MQDSKAVSFIEHIDGLKIYNLNEFELISAEWMLIDRNDGFKIIEAGRYWKMVELNELPIEPIDEELISESDSRDKEFVDGCVFTPTSDDDIYI